jgi:hypothetical protein
MQQDYVSFVLICVRHVAMNVTSITQNTARNVQLYVSSVPRLADINSSFNTKHNANRLSFKASG